MSVLNVFSGDAFSLMSMTKAINKLPYKPSLLGALGIFTEVPITTTVAGVEEQNGKLTLLNTAVRGTIGDNSLQKGKKRKVRNFNVPHVPYWGSVMADEIQNVRAFGSETELQSVAQIVNDKLTDMRNDHEVTREFHRINALKGILLDGDNSTVIYNYYTEFGSTQLTSNFVVASTKPATMCSDVIRKIGNNLGNNMIRRIYCICGDTYFDALVTHADVKAAYERWVDKGQAGEFLRTSKLGEWYGLAANSFEYQNIMFINYRGKIGDVDFLSATEAYYFPDAPGVFQEVIAPAPFEETVNTRGIPFYARQEPMPMGVGRTLHTNSNILALTARPGCVIKSTSS